MPRLVAKRNFSYSKGMTLVELLIAMGISSILVIAGINVITNAMQARTSAEEIKRKRTEWNLAKDFIEAEVALATRVIVDNKKINIPEECGIKADEFTHAVVFPLERARHERKLDNSQVLPAAIYGVQSITDGSAISGNALVRCGPRINHNLSYGGFYQTDLCSSGQDSNCREVILDNLGSSDTCKDGFCVNATACESDGLGQQGLRFYLLANGLSNKSSSPYGQCLGTKSRVAPVYYFPDKRNVCAGDGNVNKKDLLYVSRDRSRDDNSYGRDGNRTLKLPQAAIGEDQQVVMCGANFFDEIQGSDQNDIIEASDRTLPPSSKGTKLFGRDGDDRLLGGDGNDTLEGGAGDDVLIGGKGRNVLRGGSGKNSYLAGAGEDTIEGSDGVDIIYIPRARGDISLGSCTKAKCVVSQSGKTPFKATITKGDVLVFLDGRRSLY